MKRWEPDQLFKFDKTDGTIICSSPNRWLAAEHSDSLVLIYTKDETGNVITLNKRITFEDFMAHMPPGCLVPERRGIAVCKKMLSRIDPANRKLIFLDGATVTLKHKVAEDTMRSIGDH